MVAYYHLRDDVNIPDRWHIGEVRSKTGETPDFLSATRLFEPEYLAEVTTPGKTLDFSLTSFGVPVLTPALGDLFHSTLEAAVQVFPLNLGEHGTFRVLNVLKIEKCFDEEKSEFIKWTAADHRPDLAGQYRQVTRLALNAARIPRESQAFRVWGWQVALIVSKTLKDSMERVGCLGASFRELELT